MEEPSRETLERLRSEFDALKAAGAKNMIVPMHQYEYLLKLAECFETDRR